MNHYYNEFDPKAAAWLRDLMAEGLIPKGTIDERSITDVRPEELRGFDQAHFFAGISGWPLALRLAGWPDDKPVWTGSCPCQPFSCAGKGLGTADERHLWPAFFGLIEACRPQAVFGEQVASAEVLGTDLEADFTLAVQAGDCARANKLAKLLARSPSFHFTIRWLDGVFNDLEGARYTCWASDLPAAGVGAPHIRQRLYWVAYAQHPIGWPINVHSEDGRDGQDFGRQEAHSQSGTCGEILGLAHTPIRGQRADGSAPGQPGHVEQREQVERLQHPLREGLEAIGAQQPGPSAGINQGFWSDSSPHLCLDGKYRRIPSSAQSVLQQLAHGLPADLDPVRLASHGFPLAQKIPGRVGLLKGYGNAIVPELAAEFILAAVESIHDLKL